MPMDAGAKQLADILSGKRVLEVPYYQRSYVWKEKQCARFIPDMKYIARTYKNYFLGSIILKQLSAGIYVFDQQSFIDKQQSFSTFALFFKPLCLKSNGLKNLRTLLWSGTVRRRLPRFPFVIAAMTEKILRSSSPSRKTHPITITFSRTSPTERIVRNGLWNRGCPKDTAGPLVRAPFHKIISKAYRTGIFDNGLILASENTSEGHAHKAALEARIKDDIIGEMQKFDLKP